MATAPARAANHHATSSDQGQQDIRRSKLRLFGVALLCAKVAMIPLIFDPSSDMPFVVPKALLSHGLAYVLAAVIAALLIRFGRASWVSSWLHAPVLAFLASNVLATIFAVDSSVALYGTHARMLGLATIGDDVVVYFAIVLLVRTRRDAVALALSALGASSVVLGYEAIQMLGRDPFTWTTDSQVRPFSTLGEATALAQYLTTLAIGALGCGLLIDPIRPSVRGILLVYAAVLLVGSAATGTRSALIGVAVGGAVLVLFVWLLHPSTRARAATLVGAVSAIAVLVALLLLTPLGGRFASTIENPQGGDDEELLDRLEPSAAGRLALYEIGAQMVRERPILGYGPDNFTVGVPRYRPEGAPAPIRQSLATSAHSWVVQVATTSGVAGLVCFIAITLVAFVLTLRRASPADAVAGAAMLAAFLGTGLTTVNEFGTEWMLWMSTGMIAASTASQARTSDSSIRPARDKGHRAARRMSNVRLFAPFAVVVAAALAALGGWSAFDASRAARASQDARQHGQSSLAVDLGLRATRSDPGRANYWDTLGLAYIGAQRWQEASNAFDRARRLAPYDVRYIGDLVQAQLLLANAGDSGARARAIQFSDEAVRIDPNNPRPHLTRAVAMQVTGNLPEALRSVERALVLDPGSTNAPLYVTAAQVMLDSGHAGDAVRVARQGLGALGPSRASVAVRIELARALAASGQPNEALAELDAALLIQPGEPTAERLRAEIRAGLPQ